MRYKSDLPVVVIRLRLLVLGSGGVWVLGLMLCLALAAQPARAISHRTLLTVTGNNTGDQAGSSACTTAADLNGDGYPDIVVTAPTASSNAGAVYIYFGGPAPRTAPDVTLTGEASSQFGSSVSAAGDVNGDGYPDLIVGAPTYSSSSGRAYVFYGGSTLASKAASSADVILTGEASSAFGYSVSTAGDLNADGLADVIVGASAYSSNAGRAYLFYGGSTLTSKGAGSADFILTGEAGSYFGCSVSAAGDVNGDSRADVIVGAYGYSNNTGRAYVFYGGPTMASKGAASADVILTGEMISSSFGGSVAGAGDLNGDGRSDLVIGAGSVSAGTGRAYVFYGGPTLATKGAASADVILTGESTSSAFGGRVAAAGDVNGDGRPDLLVGASGYNSNTGRAYVFLGGSSLTSKSASNADILLGAEAPGNYFGQAVAGVGDVNGDGYADIIVGAPAYASNKGRAYVIEVYPYQLITPNGGEQWFAAQSSKVRWLGQDVADVAISLDSGLTWSTLLTGVGGQADNTVTVVAPTQSTAAALVRVVYAGQTANRSNSVRSSHTFSIVPAGVTPAAAASLLSTDTGPSQSQMGTAAVTVGDLNGDGYPDLALGGPDANSAAGAVYIYYGGAKPHATADVVLSGEASSDQFGFSIAPAGDVNADGYSDIIVGGPYHATYTGRAYVFYGGASLVSKGAGSADVILTGEVSHDYFGYSVASAGDVNGDGVNDLIVGANKASNLAGRAYIFYGGSSLVSKGAGSADGILSGEPSNSGFGASVAFAGDQNGDGRADLLVGAPNYSSNAGRAYLFYGSGISGSKSAANADMILTGNSSDEFGVSLAATDVNGDGFRDIIVGTAPSSGVGRVCIFFGGYGWYSQGAGAADVILTGEAGSSSFGSTLAAVGDVNGDGWTDLMVGDQNYLSHRGRAYLFYGGPGFASKPAGTADMFWTGPTGTNLLGAAVGSAGDQRQDGFSDIVVGAPGYGNQSGRAYVYDMNRYQILSPEAGDTWNVGATQTVSWLGAEPADLWLSIDGGASYQMLQHKVGGAASNAVAQLVPHQPTLFARIKLTPSDTAITGGDQSDSLFTIQNSISLLLFKAQPDPTGGTILSWKTDPPVGPQGISGYKLYRGARGPNETRVGPDLITATTFTDPAGGPGSSYRLIAVNGLGEDLELGAVSVGAVRSLAAWPLPYTGGDLNITFSVPSAAGAGDAPGRLTEIAVYDLSGRLVKTVARGVYSGGEHSVTWDGRDGLDRPVAGGVYFLRAGSGGKVSHLKLMVLR